MELRKPVMGSMEMLVKFHDMLKSAGKRRCGAGKGGDRGRKWNTAAADQGKISRNG